MSLELRTIDYSHARPDRDTWVSQGLALGHRVQELSSDPFRSHGAKGAIDFCSLEILRVALIAIGETCSFLRSLHNQELPAG